MILLCVFIRDFLRFRVLNGIVVFSTVKCDKIIKYINIIKKYYIKVFSKNLIKFKLLNI